jgi:hypothetical protein
MVDVVVQPLVGFKLCLDVTPLGLNGVGVISLLTDEGNCVINGMVHVTLSIKISVRSPAVTDNQAFRMVIKVSAILSGTGTRNVLPDSHSTPPNTHWPLTGCPLLYFC